MNRFRHIVWAWTATLLVFFLTGAEARSLESGRESSLDSVTLQLKWTHQFQFAGYYAALEKGYYRDAGLDVTIVPAKPDSEPMQEVVIGKAEFGVGTTDVVLLRAKGKPVVVLAVIFQHSPLVLLARKDAGIQSIHDLNGKRVMIEPHSAELFAYLESETIPVTQLNILPHSFDTKDLVKGRVDAMSGFSTDEPFELLKAGFDFMKFTPRSGGIDFYGDCLFTTEGQVRHHPKRVKAFLKASLRGWDYALKNPEEMIDVILSRYPTKKTRDHLLFEAKQMRRLIHPELIEIGYMNPGRWRHIAETYSALGMIHPDFSLDGLLYVSTLDLKRFYWVIGGLLALAFVLTAISVRIYRLNRRLQHQIREREKAEQALGESEREYRFLAENVQDILWTVDMQLNTTYVSPSAKTVVGFTPEERMKQSISEQLTPESLEIAKGILAEELKTEERDGISPDRSVTLALDFTRKDGSTVCLETAMSFIRDENSNPVGILGLSRDITDRKRAEDSLLRMERLKAGAELASGVAHHFNNMLQIIMGGSSVALMKLETGDLSDVSSQLERIRETSRFASETVKRLQSFVQLRAGKTDFTKTLDMSGICRQAIEATSVLWKTESARKGVSIEMIPVLHTSCDVVGDEDELFEMVRHLIVNAVEALPKGGEIQVETTVRENFVLLRVKDTGVGIPQQSLSRVFEPFFTTKGFQSTGMGLASAYGVATNHGGTISVDCTEQEGTTFTVKLPLAEAEVSEPEIFPGPVERSRLRILVIDDMIPVVMMLEDGLTAYGHHVLSALSGEEALGLFDPRSVDLVICDLAMPSMSGWEVGKRIKAACLREGMPKVPFIMLTGWGGQLEEKEQLVEAGVDAVVEKPIDLTALITVIEEAAKTNPSQ